MPSGNIAILTLTVKAGGALAAGRFGTRAGASPAAGAGAFGCPRTKAEAAGDLVPCDVQGTTVAEAGAAITADQTVQVDAQGRVVPFSTGAAVGRAMEAAGAAGAFIEILLVPTA